MLDGFDFSSPSIDTQLTGKLSEPQALQRASRAGRSISMKR